VTVLATGTLLSTAQKIKIFRSEQENFKHILEKIAKFLSK